MTDFESLRVDTFAVDEELIDAASVGPELAHLAQVYLRSPRALVWHNPSPDWRLFVLLLPIASRLSLMANPIFAQLARAWGLHARFVGIDRDGLVHDFRSLLSDRTLKMLVHLLGARNHWVNRAVVLVSILALAGVALLIMRANARPDTQQLIANLGWLFALPLLLGPVFDPEKRNVRLKDTAGEQALLRLVPPLPAGASAFNRKVAVTLLRTALLEWAMLAGAVLCLGMMTGASAANLFKQACLCCLTLPLVAATLRDHAHRSG
ncbi:MAG: hypothetical protein NTV19_12295, partial [Burkholderiales bacterium]|nr:hypothetical protein [Burkholderiales bacterium]